MLPGWEVNSCQSKKATPPLISADLTNVQNPIKARLLMRNQCEL